MDQELILHLKSVQRYLLFLYKLLIIASIIMGLLRVKLYSVSEVDTLGVRVGILGGPPGCECHHKLLLPLTL